MDIVCLCCTSIRGFHLPLLRSVASPLLNLPFGLLTVCICAFCFQVVDKTLHLLSDEMLDSPPRPLEEVPPFTVGTYPTALDRYLRMEGTKLTLRQAVC